MQVTLTKAKKAFRLFTHAGVDKSTIRHNVAQYLKAIDALGDKYILAKPIVLKRLDNRSVLGN